MCVMCGDSVDGQECDFCGESVCDDCIVEPEGISSDIFCSEDCVRDFGGS